MKLYGTLEYTLKKEPNFVTENGELKKWVVISKAQNHDAGLISLLLEDKDLKAKFFLTLKAFWSSTNFCLFNSWNKKII